MAPEAPTLPTGGGFDELDLHDTLHAALREAGYRTPTPIQRKAIPHVLDGQDVLGCAQTGTGKTAAFALPILDDLLRGDPGRGPRVIEALVLAPTRELAAQIHESFETYARGSRLRAAVIFGGVGKRPQEQALRRGVDVLVATPGRLLDLMNDGFVDLRHLRTFVLDEADRMLDMGFIHDVRRIAKAVPEERQTLLFSATMPGEIERLAASLLYEPVRLAVDPVSSTAPPIEQSVYFVDKSRKTDLLRQLLEAGEVERALVFTRTKHGANRLVQKLGRANIEASAIHGNKSQSAREAALRRFKAGETRVVVATDLAARGIDVKGLSHVINFDLPNEPETYVHRIGRTGRAGESGIALSLCAPDERAHLTAIERLTKKTFERRETPEVLQVEKRGADARAPRGGSSSRRGRGGRSRSGGQGSTQSASSRAGRSGSGGRRRRARASSRNAPKGQGGGRRRPRGDR